MTAPKHPIQPLIKDNQGQVHFKENAIVRFLLDAGPFTMSQIGAMPFNNEDRAQLVQLIGYTLAGFSELPYVADETYNLAYALAKELEEASS